MRAPQVFAGGAVELHAAKKHSVFVAAAREPGLWSVRYRAPLSCFQAFCIAVSIVHNPGTATLDGLQPDKDAAASSSADTPERVDEGEVEGLAAEMIGALERGGVLKEAHERYYKPEAQALMATAVQQALREGAGGSAEDLAAGLGDVLAKVGLKDRLDSALSWAAAQKVSSLGAMHALLSLQESQWGALLSAMAPTKAYHKMRIAVQLKKKVAGLGLPQRTVAELFWAKVDHGKVEAAEAGAEDEQPETSRGRTAEASRV